MQTVYMAGPLFTLAEREHNLRLAAAIEQVAPHLKCVLPQVVADSLLPDLEAVVEDCWSRVRTCHVVVACLDGPDADSGTAAELGYARAFGIPVVGYRTDFRGSEIDGVNAMLRFGSTAFVFMPSASSTIQGLACAIAVAVEQAMTTRAPDQALAKA